MSRVGAGNYFRDISRNLLENCAVFSANQLRNIINRMVSFLFLEEGFLEALGRKMAEQNKIFRMSIRFKE